MDKDIWVLCALLVVGLVAIIGFFKSKSAGFGPFTTGILLLLLAVVIASLLYSVGRLSDTIMANLLFTVIGFAGGLFTVNKD